jgi:RNA polymerase sigma factor (TIGR02999 family)
LHEFSKGDRAALDRLMPIVYSELQRIAHGQLRGERVGHTLNTTGLVHEAFLKLVNLRDVDWQNRAHFFAVAARLMRQILIDYARARNRDKRGGGIAGLAVPAPSVFAGAEGDILLALDEALKKLEALDERRCRVVECRCFAGMSVEETAAALNTSPATVKRDWAFSRAWLNRELGEGSSATFGDDSRRT